MLKVNRPVLIYQDPQVGETILEFDTETEARLFFLQLNTAAEIQKDSLGKLTRIKVSREVKYV